MKSRPAQLRMIRLRQIPSTRTIIPPRSNSFRAISNTFRLQAENASSSSKKPEDEKPESDNASSSKRRPPPEEDNAPPQSPFGVFMRVFREEIEKNKGWQDNVKQLQGDVDKFADSAALKRSKELYERMRITALIKSNPRLQAAVKDLQSAGISVSDAINRTLQDSEVLKAIAKASGYVYSAASAATQPIRDTAAYKVLAESVEEAFEDTTGAGGRYGGYEEKEERRRRRAIRAEKAGRKASKRVAENPEAGEALVVSSTPEKPSRLAWLKSSPTYQSWMETYQESESPFITSVRSLTSTLGRWFDETETAQTIRAFKNIDPDFTIESFTRELREYIVPEIVDGYLSADRDALKQWCGEATFNMLWATVGEYVKKGLISDSKVLDIKNIDIVKGAILENDIPVFVVSFQTQELLLFRNAKTLEVVVGSEDKVEACTYALVLTRDGAQLDNELTGGWKTVEMARRGAR